MKEFTCVVCGKKAISRAGGKEQKYCSKECGRIAYLRKNGWGGKNGPGCRFNDEVACDVQRCENCGWNPEVEKRRKAALYE